MECEGRRSPSPPPPSEPETVPTPPPAAAVPSPSTAPAPLFARDPGSSEPMPSSDDPDVDADTDTGTAAHGPQESAAEEAEAAAPLPAATVLTNDLRYNIVTQIHALVEYETVEAAEKAVASLNDEKNWSGMRVELLLKRRKKYGFIQRGHKENLSEKGDHQTPDVGMDGQMSNSVNRQGETVQTENSSGGKSRRQSRYTSRGRGQQSSNGQGHGHVNSNCIGEGTSKAIAGPKMPDGTRGFTMGRGKPAPNSQNIEML